MASKIANETNATSFGTINSAYGAVSAFKNHGVALAKYARILFGKSLKNFRKCDCLFKVREE
jgi:hypothetical protein